MCLNKVQRVRSEKLAGMSAIQRNTEGHRPFTSWAIKLHTSIRKSNKESKNDSPNSLVSEIPPCNALCHKKRYIYARCKHVELHVEN